MNKRPTIAYIDTEALKFNFSQLKSLIPASTGIMSVVKANAYGHGDAETAKILDVAGADFFGVALPEEGVKLRDAGIKKPIVVLGGIFAVQAKPLFDFDLTPVIFDLNTASALNEYASKRGEVKNVHVKIDTGMGRIGLQPDEVTVFFNEFAAFKHLNLEGVLSHFSSADQEGAGREFSEKQIIAFNKAVKEIRALGYGPRYLHMANSAAIVELENARFNLVRPGIALYGAYPSTRFESKLALKPVMQIKTRVLCAKSVPKGFAISYGRRFITKKSSIIATLPIGYGDGLPRALSNKGEALINGKRAPIAGTICMDLTMCDVTGIPGVRAGDEAVIIGSQGGNSITVEEVAEKSGTISYEVLCGISRRVPRIYE
ncbi:alanine racemase [bacterium]|nr:MAG: alanine racemase [bacterium]